MFSQVNTSDSRTTELPPIKSPRIPCGRSLAMQIASDSPSAEATTMQVKCAYRALIVCSLMVSGRPCGAITVATVGDSFADSLYSAPRARPDLVRQYDVQLGALEPAGDWTHPHGLFRLPRLAARYARLRQAERLPGGHSVERYAEYSSRGEVVDRLWLAAMEGRLRTCDDTARRLRLRPVFASSRASPVWACDDTARLLGQGAKVEGVGLCQRAPAEPAHFVMTTPPTVPYAPAASGFSAVARGFPPSTAHLPASRGRRRRLRCRACRPAVG